jgi:uncharacterized DUF497 family protein
VRITFDKAKRARTLAEREIDFADAVHVFAGRTLDVPDERRDYGELRMQTVGYLAGRMVMVVWTPRGGWRRIISMRKCNEREQARYRDELETA